MKLMLLVFVMACVGLTIGEPPVGVGGKRARIYRGWASSSAKSAKQIGNAKQKTLVVQIRSDEPVPLVLKGGRGGALHGAPRHNHLRGGIGIGGSVRPLKLTAPIYLKHHGHHGHFHHLSSPSHHHHHVLAPLQSLRKPLKLKLISGGGGSDTAQLIHKPATSYGTPFKYEKPSTVSYSEVQNLPFETNANFLTEHFTPIHTIPAPNLTPLHDNHLSTPEESYLPPSAGSTPQPQPYHQSKHNLNSYQVLEESTNDHTLIDPLSGAQTLFAPDPDPSLPTAKVRPATESFNKPSNSQLLPLDVQTNVLLPAQPIVQIVGAQPLAHAAATIPEIYPIQAQLQPVVHAAAAAAPVPIYNPTYLVTQSNNLYTQHQQQLFRPTAEVIAASYANADLTQQVASDGQILQAAKDPLNNIHPVLDSAPQFAALIAAPALAQEQHSYDTAAFHLPNAAAAAPQVADDGFIVSHYYGNAGAQQDSSQLLQAYAEELAAEQQQQYQLQQQQQEHQQQQADFEQLQHQQLLLQQQNHLLELQQQQHQQSQNLLYQPQAAASLQQQQPLHEAADPSSAAFREHERLVHQQLGGNTPLRIFVPDEETARLQRRADILTKGSVEDADEQRFDANSNDESSSFEVSSSVEVANRSQDNHSIHHNTSDENNGESAAFQR